MMNLLSSLILLFKTGLGSVVCHGANFIAGINSGYASLVFNNVLNFLADVALRFIWMVEQFVLGIMEMLELVINEFLGIGTTMNDYLSFAEKNEFTSTLVKVFRALLVVALVLMIIFTIYALIRQEREMFKNDGGLSGENKKGPIVKKLFISILVAVLLPFTMIIVIGAVNSVLTSFNNAIKTTSNTSIAGQVLATSTYDTNKYRAYAKQNKRIPIVIQAYNVSDYGADQTDDLLFKIKSFTVQNQLKNTAANIAQGMGLSFAESVTYSNNKLSNSSAYADYYENFICTAEQYEAMADFIDYCEITNTNFYIKAVNDPDVEWKYVDSATFNQNEKILTITYKNASKIGASSLTANALTGNSQSDEVYTLTYSTSYDISSPISDSLDAISALLGINDYKDMLYNTMERDDNFINSVRWANEKVSVHFSENFDISKKETWTSSDQIIMFEYYNFSNANTFSKYSFDDLSYNNRGKVTLDAKKVVYRTYIPEAGAYSHEKEIYCVLINGSYYLVVKSEIEEDEYGNKLFVLKEFEGVDFLETNYKL